MTIMHLAERPGRGRLGRHVEHDHRSLAFGFTAHMGPLKSVQWDRYCLPYDQGDLGSCTGNAMAGLLMTGPFYKPGRILAEADAVSIYGAATLLDTIPGHYPPDDTGSSGLAVAKVAFRRGLITGYRHAFSIQSALAALAAGPVITGIPWYEGFDVPQGDAAVVSISGEIRGGHEICVDGLDLEAGYVRFTNSWGSDWGNKGTARMSFDTWQQLLRERGDVTVALR